MRANPLQNKHCESSPLLATNRVEVRRLGVVEYGAAYQLQKKLHQQRVQGKVGDTLLLLEHPPTITVGKAGSIDNILVPRETLHQEGISLYFVDRGGDVTYHGPGQLVGYPILDLSSRGGDLKRYVRELEEVLIRTLEDFSIKAGRDPQHVGVWIDQKKIASIGLSIREWVTMHGFALNVAPALEHISLIHGCGLKEREATSMEDVLGVSPSLERVTESLLQHFSEVFDPEP
jgi:lipoate-protein ligase B